jgi:Protein of unknown function (DUF3313)
MKQSNNKQRENSIALIFLALVLGACATPTPTLDTGPDADVSFDGLHEIKNSAAARAWAAPDVDLSGYAKIKLQSAGIEYRPGGESGGRTMSSRSRSRGGPYEITEAQKERIAKVVGEVVLEELGKSEKFTLVNESGPDVLVIRVALLDVVSMVPPDTIGRSDVFLSSVGEATLVLEIRDSITDAIFVRAIDRRIAEDMSGRLTRSTAPTNTAEVKRLIRRWMSTLRERLDEFSGYANTG